MRDWIARLRAWKPSLQLPGRKQLAGASVAVGVLLVGMTGLGPLVRHRVDELAARYHLDVEVGRVWPSLGGVKLEHVRVRARDTEPWLQVELDRVVVDLGLTLRPRVITVQGGTIAVSGALDEVMKRARALRGDRKGGDASGSSAAYEVSVGGVGVSWPGALDPTSTLEVTGLRFARARGKEPPDDASSQQVGLVGFDMARASAGGASLVARDAEARFARKLGQTEWTGARIGSVDAEVALGSAGARPAPGPLAVPPAMPMPGEVSPGYAALAARVHDHAARVADWSAEHLARDGVFEVVATTMSLTHGAEALHIGPGRLSLARAEAGVAVAFAPGQSGQTDGAGLSVHALLPRAGDLVAQIDGGAMTLASLGVREGNFGLIDVGRAVLRAKMAVRLRADARTLTFDGDGQLSSLSIVHRALADEPVRGIDLGWSAAGLFELDGSTFRMDDLRLALGNIVVRGSGVVTRGLDFIKLEAHASVPPSDCGRMFASLPHALVPKLVGMVMEGTASLRTGIVLDTSRPDDMDIEWNLVNRCRITAVPSSIDVRRFSEPFRHTIYDEHGNTLEVTTGPGTPDWVPLHAMSPFLELAITTTEDGGFRSHGGFDKGAIKSSIRDNLRSGRFLRGASTISMQLAKNLYLAREKNLSRKLQEAILTTYLEQSLSKDEILELYFNIVEFGPMLYGVGSAADHYFDTTAGDLSLGQALFLTSILPAPKRSYFAPTGQLSRRWLGYLHRVMRIMRARNKITDEELNDALSEVITQGLARSPRARSARDLGSEVGASFWTAPDGP